MDAVHIHLALNHIPVIGIPVALLLLVFALVRKSREARTIGFGALVLFALLAWPVYLSGNSAEDRVEKLTGVSEETIDRHKDAATIALVAVEILGGVGLAGLALVARNRIPRWFVPATVALALVTGGLLGWTANLGGQIRHTELRGGGPPR